jgi:hypothetical protein
MGLPKTKEYRHAQQVELDRCHDGHRHRQDRRQRPGIVTVRLQAQVMSAHTGLHPDQTRRNMCGPVRRDRRTTFATREAIAKAVERPTAKFVDTKAAEQLDLQALHRVRERLVSQRTGITYQTRAFLLGRGTARHASAFCVWPQRYQTQ